MEEASNQKSNKKIRQGNLGLHDPARILEHPSKGSNLRSSKTQQSTPFLLSTKPERKTKRTFFCSSSCFFNTVRYVVNASFFACSSSKSAILPSRISTNSIHNDANGTTLNVTATDFRSGETNNRRAQYHQHPRAPPTKQNKSGILL